MKVTVPVLLAISSGCLCALVLFPLSSNHVELATVKAGSSSSLVKASVNQAAVESLWNAAKHDEIRLDDAGKLRRYEMTAERAQLLKVDPEYDDNVPHKARVTTLKKAVYHPLAWLRNQPVPSAIKARSTAAPRQQKSARTQELWNAAANDEIQPGSDSESVSVPTIRWLHDQHDEAEMASLRSRGSYAFGDRIFSHGGDHERNMGGDYVEDNSIGVKVGALKGRKTMLDMWDQPNPGAAASGGQDGSMTWMGYRSASGGFNRNQSPYTGPGGAQDHQEPRDPRNSAGGRVYGAPYSSTADPNYGYSDYWKQYYGGR